MWFLLALTAGLLFAANRLVVRSILIKNVHPVAFGAVHELLAGLLLLPIGLFYFSLPQSLYIWLALGLGIFFIFLCDLFAFLSLGRIEASLYQIIGQLRHVVVLIGAYFLFAETISLSKMLSIFLIILGVYVAIMAKSKIAVTKGTIYGFLSTLFIALAFLFIKMASVDVAPAFSGALSLLISGVLMSTLLFIRGEKVTDFIKTHYLKQLSIAAIIFAGFEFTLFTALAVGEASRVTPVTQSSMIFTIIGGYLFLKERAHIKQKIVGSMLIAFGIILLYFI